MSKLSRSEAIKYIKNWTTEEVIQALKKNGLDECCEAVLKRQIDGEELWLHDTSKFTFIEASVDW